MLLDNSTDKGRILIVDDEEKLLNSTKILLQDKFHVETALNGEEALSKLTSNSYCALILDIIMPGLSGIDMLKRLRSAGNSVPVVMMTGRSCLEYSDEVASLGVRGHLDKPFDIKILEEMLRLICLTCSSCDHAPDMSEFHPKLNSACKYIKKNYSAHFGLSGLAKALGISAPYLGRLFKRQLGLTFTQFLNHCRIENAKRLIYESDESLVQIMGKVGYNTEQHFFTQFKRYTGCPPSCFKKWMRDS